MPLNIKYIIALLFTFLINISVNSQKSRIKHSQHLTTSNGLAHNGVTCILEDSRGFIWFSTYEGINKYNGYSLKTFKNTSQNKILTSNRVRTLFEDKNGNIWIGTDNGITIYNYLDQTFKKINIQPDLISDSYIIRKIISTKNLIICATEGNGLLLFNHKYELLNKIIPSKNPSSLFFNGVQLNSENLLFATSSGLILYNTKNNKLTSVVKEIKYARTILSIDSNHILVPQKKGIVHVKIDYNNSNLKFTKQFTSLNNIEANSLALDKYNNLWIGGLLGGLKKITTPNLSQKINKKDIQIFKDDTPFLRSSSFLLSSYGHCWYGTFNKGVYKFNLNANNFNYYHTNLNNDKGIQSNVISTFSKYDNNRVLITEYIGGLTLFNTKTKKFEKLPFKPPLNSKKTIRGVFTDSKKHIWLDYLNDNLIYHLNENGKYIEKINLTSSDVNCQTISYSEDTYGNIWIGTTNNVYKLNINNNLVTTVESLNNNSFFKTNKLGQVIAVYADPLEKLIWIATKTEGLFRVKNQKELGIDKTAIDQFKNQTASNSISSNFVTSIVRLPNKDLWIGTEGGGICKVTNYKNKLIFKKYTEIDGLSNNVVKSILYDDNSNLWVSTNIGLNKYNYVNNKFHKINKFDGLPFEDFWYPALKLNNGNFIFSGLHGFCFFTPKKTNFNNSKPKIQFENLKIFNQIIKPKDSVNKRVLINKNINLISNLNLKYNENVFSIDITSLHFLNNQNHKIRYKLSPLNKKFIEISSNQKNITYAGLQPGNYKLIAQISNSDGKWLTKKEIKIKITPEIWKTNTAYLIYILLTIAFIIVVFKVFLRIQKLNHKVELEQLEKSSLKKNNEDKLTFFSNISHEIKTPITLLSESLKECLLLNKSNYETFKRLGLIQRQTKKILKLVTEIQDVKQSEENSTTLKYSLFNFNDFLQKTTQDYTQLAISENKEFKCIEPEKTLIASADKDKIEKIIDNILSNAFKYTLEGNKIELSYHWNENYIVIKIFDNGKGISSEDLPYIFERFFQSKSDGNQFYGGSGIGLAYTKQLTEMHYGNINVYSKINKGTTFTIELPILKNVVTKDKLKPFSLPPENEIEIDSISETVNKIESISGEFTDSLIYYVEDNIEMRNYVSNILSNFYDVNSFENGQQCIDAMELKWPDLIISDVQMPVLNGLDLCIQVKSNLATSHIPIILLTALTKIEDHIQGIQDGADSYIKKPFDVNFLITSVENLLTNRKQLRERYKIGIPFEKSKSSNNTNDDVFLKKLFKLMTEKIDNQDFDIDKLAKDLFLNRTYFYQKVKALTNHTPSELLRKYRLKKAAELLINEKYTVNEVFLMTGFKSRTHFTKIFKDTYNVTPGKYASSITKKDY